jgi:hypothetical protein
MREKAVCLAIEAVHSSHSSLPLFGKNIGQYAANSLKKLKS